MNWLNDNDQVVFKALTIFAIEKTLLDVGKPAYDKVVSMLSKNYHCYLPDCYEHPEYLNKVLKKMFGNSYLTVVERIKKELDSQMMEQPIEIFVTKISE